MKSAERTQGATRIFQTRNGGSAVGIEGHGDDQSFFGGGRGVLPLLEGFHGGLAEDGASADQGGAPDGAIGKRRLPGEYDGPSPACVRTC
jgi:hypothetical protein